MKLVLAIFLTFLFINARPEVAKDFKIVQWEQFRLDFSHVPEGNPYTDDSIHAVFTHQEKKYTVEGFYRGDSVYQVRFMPTEPGLWSYTLSSNLSSIDGRSGSFECVPVMEPDQSMVQVFDTYHFQYSGGGPFYPFGTTIYSFVAQTGLMEDEAFQVLASGPFNKIRFCLFPQWQDFSPANHQFYPFQVRERRKTSEGKDTVLFDLERFDPAYFLNLERKIEKLLELGIEADLILFHPYDEGHWGLDKLPAHTDHFYLKYLIARLGAYRNVWWSLANEYDFLKAKSQDDWEAILKAIKENDPYGHLCSIHNAKRYFANWLPGLTHASIQNGALVEDFGRAVILRDAYHKPVIYDEVCYEGDLAYRWGNLSPQELVHRFWQASIAGTYASHGETYAGNDSVLYLVTGTRLKGKSAEQIRFLKDLVEETGYWEQTDHFWGKYHIAKARNGDVLVYFGTTTPKEWSIELPKELSLSEGSRFKIRVIDTWNLTTVDWHGEWRPGKPEGYLYKSNGYQPVQLPGNPYMAIHLKKIKDAK